MKVWLKNKFVDAEIIKINKDVICCKGTEGEYIHPITYDVKLQDETISYGHLVIHR